MKKWLVGLLAAGLCAASAWAASYTLVSSASEITEGKYVILGGTADSAMKNVADSSSRISAEAVTVTDGVITDPDASLVWTLTKDGDKWLISSTTDSGTVYAAAPSSAENKSRLLTAPNGNFTLWSIANSATAGLVAVQSEEYTDRYLQKNNSGAFFACYKTTSNQKDVRFFKEGSAALSVAIVPSEEFSADNELTVGTAGTLTAEAKNGEGTVTFAWSGSFKLEGESIEIPADLTQGEYSVTVTATDSSEPPQTATADFTFTVVPAPQAYTVTVADGIENGTVEIYDGETLLANPADVFEGTVLTVVATPATRSYKVESVTVTGEESGEIALENGEFAMPAENVSVTATFALRSGDLFEKITSVEALEAGAYVITGAGSDGNEYAMLGEASTSTSSTYIKRQEDPVEVVSDSITGPDDSIIWTLAQGEAGWTFNNASAGYVCYVPNMGNSANVEAEVSTRSSWTISATEEGLFAVTNVGDSTRVLRYNPQNPRFACYTNPATGKSLAFYKKVGPGTFSLALDPAANFDVTVGDEAAITATVKNAQGDVSYAWSVDGVDIDLTGATYTIDTSVAGGPFEVKCVATDTGAEGVTAEASVSYAVLAAPVVYDVVIAEGIEHGSIAVEPASGVAGTEITVTAIPDEGYALAAIFVNGEGIEGTTFEMPEGGATVSATFEVSSVKFATYTVASKSAVETTGEVPEGSEAAFESNGNSATQLTGGTSMTLTLTGYEGCTIKGLTLSMKSNARGGAGSLSAKCGDAVIAAIADAKFNTGVWYGAWSGSYVDIAPAVTPTVVDGAVVITIAASENSIYCQSFTVAYEPGTPAFSVALDPAEAFEVVQDEEASVTATAKNAAGDVTYAWTVDGVAAETDGAVLALPTAELGEHAVVCVATDGGAEGATAEASVGYTVLAPAAKFAVTVAEDIENGTVEVDKDEAAAGETVTVTATPADGYALQAILVDGEPIGGDSFEMPDHAVTVSATFDEVVDYATLPFLAVDTPFTGPWQNAKVTGVTVEGLGSDYNSDDGRGGKFDSTGDWLQIKFEGTPDELSYALKGNGTSEDNVSTFDVLESATGDDGTWTPVASHKSGENLFNNTKTNFTAALKTDSRFVKFVYTEKAAGNVALYDVYISSGDFSVSFDKEDGFEVEQGTEDSITATAKNGEEPYYFTWTCATAVELNQEDEGLDTLAIPATLDAGDYTVEVLVIDAQGETIGKSISFSVVEPAAKYPVIIADGILNGTVEADPAEAAEGETVTLTATPEPGYKLELILVSHGEEILEFTSSPAEFAMPAAEVRVVASFVESHDVRYVPVESADDFVAGEEYLIVAHKAGSFTSALNNLANGSRIDAADVTISGDGSISTDDAGIVWKIQAGGEEGQYVLFNEAANVYAAATKNDNYAQLLPDGTNALAQWTLDLTALPSVKIVSVSYSTRWLQRNSQADNAFFAIYTGSQTTPMLFKKAGPAVFDVTVDKDGFDVPLGTVDTVTATAKNGVEPYIYVWSSETESLVCEGPELAIPDTLPAGEYTVLVTATDSSAEPQTAFTEVTFTVVAPLPVYTVTVAEGIENGTVEVDKTEAEAGETVTVTATPADNYKLVAILVNGTPIEGNTFEIAADSVVSAEFAEIVKFQVAIADGIPNGYVEADKEEAEAGETVTLTAFPEDGYKLVAFIVNGEAIVGNTFAMPEDDALVTAEFAETESWTFVPVESASDFEVGGEYLLVAVKAETYTDAMKNAASGTRIGVDAVTIAEDGSITTDNAGIVWTIRAGEGENQYVLFNETGRVYAAGPNSAGNGAQLVEDGTVALAQWELDFTALPSIKIKSVSYGDRWLQRNKDKGNAYFATYNTEQATPLLFKKAGFSVGFDKEDGFTVEEGNADSITATAVRGVEPYSFVWSGDLAGEGETLAIPADLAQGAFTVTVTATDSSEPPLTATKSISFEVVAPVVRYAITVDEGIENGEVTVDKTLAEAGEEVTVTATPAAGYALVSITVNGTPLTEGNTFTVEGDSVVSATFSEILDYATLPFVSQDTPYSGPWFRADLPTGMTAQGLGSDYNDGSAKFDGTGDWLQVKFAGTPGKLSYQIKGNSIAATEEKTPTFAVQESADGVAWTDVKVYSGVEALDIDTKAEHELSEDSRFVRFFYTEKAQGNVGINDIYIGTPGETEPTVTVTGETTVRVDDTFQLVLALENYAGGEFTWEKDVLFGYIYDGTFWWDAEDTGSYEVTFSAVDGNRTIASETVTLTIQGVPALVFDGDAEGTVGAPVNFTVVAENVADPTVTFMGFLAVPEGSALTDESVALDFPNVTFTPDVAGDYGLSFCAGEGADHVEDLHIVTVAAAPAEPAVALVDGETTVELGDYFLLQFALENYAGEFDWAASLGEIDEDGIFSWTPEVAGEFEVTVSALAGDEIVATTTVTLTVTGEEVLAITGFSSSTAGLSFEVPAGVTVEAATSLVDADWTAIDIAPVDGKVLIPFEGNGKFYRLAK